MEIHYKNYSVRIVHNPSDIIVRFVDTNTQRIWETTLTERNFIEYQILGGLEFIVSVLREALTTEAYPIVDFKATPKNLSFTMEYIPDEHCKMIPISLSLTAIKKESANLDLEIVSAQMNEIKEMFQKMHQTTVQEMQKQVQSLQEELALQKERCSGYIILPGCSQAIDETLSSVNIGLRGTTNPITGTTYTAPAHGLFVHDTLRNINTIAYLRKCTVLTICNTNIKDYSPIGKMTQLKNLSIIVTNAIHTLSNIGWIANLLELESVCIYGCATLADIEPLAKLPKLKTIDIRGSAVKNTSMFTSSITFIR